MATETGRPKDEFVRDAMAGYFDELVQVYDTLDTRYDDMKSGKVKLIPGDEVITRLSEKSAARRRSQHLTGYDFHPEAALDLADIWDFIGQDSSNAADRVVADMLASIEAVPPSGTV